MNITPERALELANKISAGECRLSVQGSFVLSNLMDCDRDIVAVLRAYADIAPKWQAVLDAPAVAYVAAVPVCDVFGVKNSFTLNWGKEVGDVSDGAQLIIKPAP